jgi:hypothetical protein
VTTPSGNVPFHMLPYANHLRQLVKNLVGVEKVTELVLARATTTRL